MENDIRDLVHATSPPRPDAKSLKSRSKSTSAKSSKKKKKSTDSKSKSKSTTTAKKTKKKKRDSSATRRPDPETLTIQVPPAAVAVPLATTAVTPLSPPLSKTSVSEHLQEIINDSTIPVASTSPTAARADTHIEDKDNDETEKASKPRKKKELKKRSSSSKRKEQTKEKQQQREKEKQEEEEREEKRKRRERLLVSPFEFLHITHFRHGEDEFHDDISFLTLPKPLRDQEAKFNGSILSTEDHLAQVDEETATPQVFMPDNGIVKQPAVDSSNTSADPPQPAPAPGWARKAKPERTASDSKKEQACTDLSQSPEISSLPSAHPHRASPAIPVTTSHTNTNQTQQPETSNENNENPPKNHLLPMNPQMEGATAVQAAYPQTLLPTLDRPRSWTNIDLPPSDPSASIPHSAQESPYSTTQERPLAKGKFRLSMLTPLHRQGTVPTENVHINNDIESGNAEQHQGTREENKSTLVHHHPAKNHLWFIASATVCFVFLVLLTIILVVILAKN